MMKRMHVMGRRRGVAVAVLTTIILTSSGCAGQDVQAGVGGSPSETPSAEITGTESSEVDVMTTEPAPGLAISISSEAQPSQDQSYVDGRVGRGFDVDDGDHAYTVIIEYYEPGGKSAAEVLDSEMEAFDIQGGSDDIIQNAASVSGSDEAYRLDWEQSSEVPWSGGVDGEIDITCTAIIFDGQGGYSYAVYTYSETGDDASLAAVNDVIDSIQVSQP